MKSFILILILVAGLGFSNKTFAIHPANSLPSVELHVVNSTMSVKDFISLDFKEYRTANGKKLKWTQRLAFQIIQKKLTRKLSQHQLKGSATLKDVDESILGNKRGVLSVIFAAVGVISFFLPTAVAIIGFLVAVAGFILGIMGLRKDEDILLALIGTILGALVISLYAITLIG